MKRIDPPPGEKYLSWEQINKYFPASAMFPPLLVHPGSREVRRLKENGVPFLACEKVFNGDGETGCTYAMVLE